MKMERKRRSPAVSERGNATDPRTQLFQPHPLKEMEEPPAAKPTSAPALPPPEVAAAAVVVEGSRRRAGALKRKAASISGGGGGNASAPSKRFAKEKALLSLPPLHNGPCTRARQSPIKLAAAAAKPAEPSFAPPPKPAAAEEERKVPEPLIDVEFETVRSRDTNAHVVPTPAGWFSWTKIHPLEERTLASFFNGKSEERTSDIYMEIRNAIMKKFHTDPHTNVEPKDLSELSVGNSEAKQEVMEFLDHWGLINFHPFPSPPDSAAVAIEVEGTTKASSLIEKLYRFELLQSTSHLDTKVAVSEPTMLPRLLPESAIFEDLVRPEEPAVEYHCNSCSADCSRKRYHCQTQADFDLCTECYNDAKFGSGMAPADFILMEPAEVPGVSGGSWTDQETLLLLEALELYGENWNEIAEHVATKTKAQCMLHFVQMPIEDPFLEGSDDVDVGTKGNVELDSTKKDISPSDITATKKETTTTSSEEQPSPIDTPKPIDAVEVECGQESGSNFALDVLKAAFEAVGSVMSPAGNLSFADAANPVMTLAAFLAGFAETDVAAAAAQSSLKAMSEDSPSLQLALRNCFLLVDPPNDKKDPPALESVATDTVDGKAQKDEDDEVHSDKNNENGEVRTDENNENAEVRSYKNTENGEVSSDKDNENGEVCTEKNNENGEVCTDKNNENEAAPEECVTSPKESTEKSLSAEDITEDTVKKSDESALLEEVNPVTLEVKETDDSSTMGEIPLETVQEVGALPSQGDISPSPVVKESPDLAAVEEDEKFSELAKPMDISIDMIPTEVKEPQQAVDSGSAVEAGENKVEDVTKVSGITSEKDGSTTEIKEVQKTDRLKRAAITALSAAAVKAKLFADQEDDQIRELASLLIEKQLRKLETKLSLFSEMEGVIMRVREQLDRARQKLYHERAQIIAARLGLPASSSRPISSLLPPTKVATNFANTGLRPPSVTSQKPPVKGMLRALSPPQALSSFHNTTSGSSNHSTGQDPVSSVGTRLGP